MASASEFDSKLVSWRQAVTKYQKSDSRRSWWQVVNTVLPYFILFYLMVRSLEISYWITLALAIPATGFFARTFIIFHDCGHGSFFKSRQANSRIGFFTGIITFTPYYQWRHAHALHHATSGDLDRRGIGDIWTMTVREYAAANWKQRFAYRVYRHPVALFVFGPLILFLISHRFAAPGAARRERLSVVYTNLALLAIAVTAYFTIGLKAYVLVQLPVLYFGAAAGVWLFYVQHQFEGVYWEHHDQWDYVTAAIYGSSFYKLPKLLQWFTGNIGFHHVHHLSPRVPNYNLEKCHQEIEYNPPLKPVTLGISLRSLGMRLWDEERRQMVGFRAVKLLKATAGAKA